MSPTDYEIMFNKDALSNENRLLVFKIETIHFNISIDMWSQVERLISKRPAGTDRAAGRADRMTDAKSEGRSQLLRRIEK